MPPKSSKKRASARSGPPAMVPDAAPKRRCTRCGDRHAKPTGQRCTATLTRIPVDLMEDEIQTDLSDRVQSSPIQREQPAGIDSRVQPADPATVRMQRSVDLMAASMVKLSNTVTNLSDQVKSMQEDR